MRRLEHKIKWFVIRKGSQYQPQIQVGTETIRFRLLSNYAEARSMARCAAATTRQALSTN